MRIILAMASAVLGATLLAGCTQDAQAMDAQRIEQQYGVSGASDDTIVTADGPLKGTLVPITLANGTQAHLFIPAKQTAASDAVYLRDEQGLHPIRVSDTATREQVTQSPALVQTAPAPQPAKTRSWEKEVMIIGGSAGGGAAIGAIAGGKKGAAVGAAAGGVGGLIYDIATRNNKK